MRDWLAALEGRVQGGPVVRVVVSKVRGSAPREAGACMLVSANDIEGTVGGGHLEFVATRIAREMLAQAAAGTRRDRFPLAASLGQCCGGIVELWFERFDTMDRERLAEARRLVAAGASPEAIAACASRDPDALRYERFSPGLTDLWLFGAGHVGAALVHVLSPLPFAIHWVDSREGLLPTGVPPNVHTLHSPQPHEEVGAMGDGDFALVLTHSHDEDFAICQALLEHGRFAWAGVIGSLPKTARFRRRLVQRGFSSRQVARLTMPIGIGGIRSKEAAAIAVSVAAQLLRVREAAVAAGTDSSPRVAARD